MYCKDCHEVVATIADEMGYEVCEDCGSDQLEWIDQNTLEPPPAPDNVVRLMDAKWKQDRESNPDKRGSKPARDILEDFEVQMRRNKDNQERMKRERNKDNDKVKRSYRLTSKRKD